MLCDSTAPAAADTRLFLLTFQFVLLNLRVLASDIEHRLTSSPDFSAVPLKETFYYKHWIKLTEIVS
ncbi:hypothetical protein Ngar_c08670 [Candidatus Nitrososphaera gargensis Ga9.2]|uniref:Uncharacterized protein n=1 Tax=Nitrososphaera gargensis (strain Ga9.2) TaxID=1237085 RepID=K0IMD3_NITGG|nr:hypothetical protein Ngar_c08670 [Candidatus Nitrososphaera gargensis Ga9.2]